LADSIKTFTSIKNAISLSGVIAKETKEKPGKRNSALKTVRNENKCGLTPRITSKNKDRTPKEV
jgi:hypothetical protein